MLRINAPEEVGFSPTDSATLDERNTNFIVCGAMKMRAETLHKLGVQGTQLDALMFVLLSPPGPRKLPLAQRLLPAVNARDR